MRPGAQEIKYATYSSGKAGSHHIKEDLKKDTDKQGQQKGYNLIFRQAAGKYPDADVHGTHQDQAKISPYCGTMINYGCFVRPIGVRILLTHIPTILACG